MGYYSEVVILTTAEGAKALTEASMQACREEGNPYPILSIDEAGGIKINQGECKAVKSACGDLVALRWPCIKWYSDYSGASFADVRAIEEVVESGEYPMQFVRAGEDLQDVAMLGEWDSYRMRDEFGLALETRIAIEVE